MSKEQKEEYVELISNSIILHLSSATLRKVSKLKTTKELWKKLKDLYLFKSTSNKLQLLERFFSFEMDYPKYLDDNLDAFKKLVQDIVNSDETVSKTCKDIILLNSMFYTYKEVNDAIKYGWDTLIFEIIIDSLRIKGIERIEK